jgi:hypothetical protein
MNKKILFICIALLILMGSVIRLTSNSSKNDDFLMRNGLDGMQIAELVSHLEHRIDEPENFTASITGSLLILGDSLEQLKIDLPEGQFYLSFAPYINQTHPCATHNLVTCRGELKNVTFHVLIIDILTRDIYFEGSIASKANGFAGIWLPKDKNYQLTVSYDDLIATEEIMTTSTSNTCLTTLRLA